MRSPVSQPFPGFDIVLRGFDRRQVDDLVHRANFTLATLDGSPYFVGEVTSFADLPEEQRPDPVTARELDTAAVDIVLRGYDRTQVMDVLSELVMRLTEAESRATRG
ncbi:hypothetical protein [Nocardiopsis halotolerans]|uniref:hypothetical protein n=1 Tax=Nocardiopsis halotolerans TaxID=124252 RepID=UPI000475DC4F|nr:hypothetical protein [Nocardiopsis halotolerans]